MASSGPTENAPAEQRSAAQDITNAPSRTSAEPVASTPVEMTMLESKVEDKPAMTTSDAEETGPSTPPKKENDPLGATATDSAANQSSATSTTPGQLDRTVSTAIGPSSDQPLPVPKDTEATGPTLMITLLLTNGARHPFKLDQRYIHKRNVKVQDNDPSNLSVYTLKELILREWREEWEQKPSSPSSIRLISFGKLLDDKAPLRDSKFSPDSPNVVHMTIKPQELIDEEDAKGGKGTFSTREREGSERSPGCRCIIL
ncbi:hypothetical protein UCRPC4_g06889 [Phaeomoniella chlamydospora]|uniref:UBL3-like ubiquitin domain-containing protein n=1 Tax=Phaeomoniella chlamydospora TaxID=158046 RepID=A0A0G2G9Y3_PHACM|nr:hypothetical protein UCRPC4_g06889 [Phaeomoniella chlamydospora]